MKRIAPFCLLGLLMVAFAVFAAGPAMAGKPSWVGNPEKGGNNQGQEDDKVRGPDQDGHGRQAVKQAKDHRKGPDSNRDWREPEHHGAAGRPAQIHHGFFSGRDRGSIDRYYGDQFRKGKCPPGLVRKGNRCLPPGQAKKWALNRPLPRDVVYYDLPREVLVSLGPPPSGHRFVRVAQDILLISIGTGMVIDALEDLGRQ